MHWRLWRLTAFFISTHAPYTEGDDMDIVKERLIYISTHAPYTEGDFCRHSCQHECVHFNSRPLYRGRPLHHVSSWYFFLFQLTPPIQRATNNTLVVQNGDNISTHAPYTEGDLGQRISAAASVYFNSRPLYRGRLNTIDCTVCILHFNSRPLYRGRLVPGSTTRCC